jgi:ABC-type ATPase involved in cell division
LIASHDLALINQLNRPVIKLHEGSIARV